MRESDSPLQDAIALLTHSQSAKRRSGAKRLRKLGDPRACPPLLEALNNEVRDPRTWETQYQMAMAIGECNCRDALPYLHELALQRFEATMVDKAIGGATVRLSRQETPA
jgi:HEAT repeat protein